jgi:hypothetical protein
MFSALFLQKTAKVAAPLPARNSAIGRRQSIQNSPKSGLESPQPIDNKGDTRYGFVAAGDGLSD